MCGLSDTLTVRVSEGLQKSTWCRRNKETNLQAGQQAAASDAERTILDLLALHSKVYPIPGSEWF